MRHPEQIGVAIGSAEAEELLLRGVDGGGCCEEFDAGVRESWGRGEEVAGAENANVVSVEQRQQGRQQVTQIAADAGVAEHTEIDGESHCARTAAEADRGRTLPGWGSEGDASSWRQL